MKDTRKKACPNIKCKTYKIKKYDSKINYCPECGTELIFVCKNRNCYRPIENLGPKHCYCKECEAIREDRRNKIKENAKKGIVTAATVGATIITPAKKVLENGGAEMLKKGAVKIVNAAEKRILK